MKRKVGLGGEDPDLMATDIRKGTAMHLNRRRFLLMSTTAVLVLPAYAQSTAGPADKIYTGGDIVTISDAQPTAEAVAVKDGLILALGSRADIEAAFKGLATVVVDLAGKTLMPSFIDPHSHYINALSML